MAHIVPQAEPQVNTVRHSSDNKHNLDGKHNMLCISSNEEHNILCSIDLKKSYDYKKSWLKAAITECGLRLNEIHVLEALSFLTDALNGQGEPSLGCIREKLIEHQNLELGYRTISGCLSRLKRKGAITIQRRPNHTNIYRLIGYEYKSAFYYADSAHDLNLKDLDLKDHSTNHYHYEEYSVFDNSQKRDLKPEPAIDEPKPLLKSEWEGARETLTQEVHAQIETKIPEEHRKVAVLTLKRMNISDEEKLILITEVGKIAKLTAIRNMGGMLVNTYRKLEGEMKSNAIRQRDFKEELKKRHEADDMAKKRLKEFGITDPRLKGLNATYEEIREYDSRLAGMMTMCLRELYEPANEQAFTSRQTWAEQAYS